jgi:hypothetical protein
MKVGDLVKYSHASGGELGIIVGWQEAYRTEPQPVVRWNDGRVHWVKASYIEVINESR